MAPTRIAALLGAGALGFAAGLGVWWGTEHGIARRFAQLSARVERQTASRGAWSGLWRSASARDGVVKNSADLLAALRSAHPGDTILLAAGTYDGLRIKNLNIDGEVTVASRDPAHPAVLRELIITDSGGLTFRDVDFSTVGAPIGDIGATLPARAEHTVNLRIQRAHHIRLSHMHFYGDPNGTLQTDLSAMILQDSDHITIEKSEFEHFHNAIGHTNVDFLTVSGNRFHDIWDDSVRGGGSSNVLVTGNQFRDIHQDASDPDHPDCIQFWSRNTTKSAHDITITDNVYVRGLRGHPAQGIFLRDEPAPPDNVMKYPFQNVVIRHNLIVGAQPNAIMVIGGANVEMSENIVARFYDMKSWIGAKQVNGLTQKNNRAPLFIYGMVSGLHESGNRIQDTVNDQGAGLVKAWSASEDPGRRSQNSPRGALPKIAAAPNQRDVQRPA